MPFFLKEARHRSEYVAQHAQESIERNEAERAAMRDRLEDKARRADHLALQRK